MKNVFIYDWVSEGYLPRYISGPDIIMRDSVWCRVNKKKSLFERDILRIERPLKEDCLICCHMNSEQKSKFLKNQLTKYGVVVNDPLKYSHLISSMESVEFVLCMIKAGVDEVEEDGLVKGEKDDVLTEMRRRDGFPDEILRAICKYK